MLTNADFKKTDLLTTVVLIFTDKHSVVEVPLIMAGNASGFFIFRADAFTPLMTVGLKIASYNVVDTI